MAAYAANPKIVGYHGTASENAESIIKNNFRESKDHRKWYGDGVYFFIDGGISRENPLDLARKFILDEHNRDMPDSPDKDKVSVMEATIKINTKKYLDLTQSDGIQLFNDYRDRLLEDFRVVGKKIDTGISDYHVFIDLRNNLGIEFVKGNEYFKFDIQRQHQKFPSTIPNVTIFVVSNPENNILKPTIKEVYRR